MTREEAIEHYIVLRLRVEDIKRLDFLLNGLFDGKILLPGDSPFLPGDLKDTVRTALFGWVATVLDRDEKAVYAFNPLLILFPHKRAQIIPVQGGLEACNSDLQQFRNNVAFHARSELAAHFKARRALREPDTFLDLVSGIGDFQRLMADLSSEELSAIPELPDVLTALGAAHHPAFSNVFPERQSIPVQ